ncbi:MAG: hypothetical protein M3220_19350 [Chloroflexota bacterium]|nr:hypothetical protein [Chloroflexota bacterium]
MRSLFKNVANEIIQQLTPEDLKEIMDSTIETVLSQMTPQQRLEFSKEIVNNAFVQLLSGFSDEQRIELLRTLLPTILGEMRIEQMEAADLVAAIDRARRLEE